MWLRNFTARKRKNKIKMENKEITKKHYRCGMCGKPTNEEGCDLEQHELKDLCVEDLEVIPTCDDCFWDEEGTL
jgi:hypothetical protein